ncbi:hypothetical protein [Streptomyces sp. NPDC101249]|uniref:hypothetical protein n=1 Tax=Streptomyces sp. NPDC101249 TaxID=3366140 RepID=UPI00380429B1
MTVACAAPGRRPSADEILDTPLPELLAAWAVERLSTSVTDRGFFGAVLERRDGRKLLAMPVNRPALESDTVARYLLAKAFDVDLPDMPPPFVTSRP